MTPPSALRLVPSGSAGSRPRPPFGLAAFDDAAEARAFEVALTDTLESLLERLPAAAELLPGTPIIILDGERHGGFAKVAKAFGRAPAYLSRTVRATALLARGYREISAQKDEGGDDLVTALA
ncbi:MAG: hypothetical protein IPG50_00605 [Myxococcales bacterium]|nr:hypothetical protein [Myxococcales bacterium]